MIPPPGLPTHPAGFLKTSEIMISRLPHVIGLLSLLGLILARDASAAPPKAVSYEQDVRPILKEHCFHCHGEAKTLAGGLDLRLRRLIVAGGDSGPAIEPGKHGDSLLFHYIEGGDMPPQEELELTPEQVATIARWIDAGAPTLGPEPKETPQPGQLLITNAERSHWSFRPIERPEIPQVATPVVNPVDAFVAQQQAEHGLKFSPPADRATLIRRATFDLIGLPPTPEDVAAFVADPAPDAYERLIDRLLASPRYGERWGRHWLDVAGYADSEGYDDADVIRPDAWAYRDYVVQSFNEDKPWDRFVIEQLAGDELARSTRANAQGRANADESALELLTATGFLRMAPDGTGSKPMDPALARNQVVTETVKIVSSSLLGLTVGCAECHHHRYDPIPQEDFYRLRAVFEPVYDVANWRTPAQRRLAILSAEDRAKADALEAEAKTLDAKHDKTKNEVLQIVLGRVLEGVPDAERETAKAAFETEAKDRTPKQTELIKETYPMLGLLHPARLHLFLARFKDGEELKKRYEEVQAEAAKLRAQKPQPTYVRVATEDPQRIPTTHVFHRGDHTSPLPDAIPPGGLTVVSVTEENPVPANDPDLPTTGRRLAYARWLVSGEHPLVARVLVNRFWMHHFGRGLVEQPGEFGLRGTPPSHPELLDWLASEWMENGWRLKPLHRRLMLSRTYRQASARQPDAEAIDADNRFLWRMPVRRLESEIVRDAMLATSGNLQDTAYGDPVPVAVNEGGLVTAGDPQQPQKRSIYVQVRRTQPVAMFEVFDAPQMEPNCERRVSSTVATQSLALMNGHFVLAQAESFAKRILQEMGQEASPEKRATRAWELAYGEPPDSDTRKRLAEFLTAQTQDLRNRKVENPETAALATLCQVLFGTNRFLYID